MIATNLVYKKRIAIIGGGPVGLTAARLLHLKGVPVTVYERDKDASARISGGTLDLHKETGQKALKQAGLLDEFYKNSRPTGMLISNKHGDVMMTMKPDKSKPEIDRPVLRKMLLDSIPETTVVWDKHVVSITKKGDVFSLHFQDNTQAEADLVIVADGGMSKARKAITSTLPEETGTYVIQGEIQNLEADCPAIYALLKQNNLADVEDKKSFFMQHRGDGSLCFYVSFRQSEQWIKDTHLDFTDPSAIRQFLCKLFNDWNPIYSELFACCDTYNGFPLRVFHANAIQTPHTGITVIGDAAHLMPPFGGLGVNMGLKDALLLTNNLTNGKFSSIQSALDDYEQKMVAYASSVQKETLAADDRIHNQTDHSGKRFKERMKLKIAKVVQFATLLVMFLTIGVFWGVWLSYSRSYNLFSLDELIHIANVGVQNLALPMRFISGTCLALLSATAYFMAPKKSKEFYFVLASIALLVITLVLTVAIEVPINNQIISWTPSTAPANWEEIRNRWQFVNNIRTIAALASFGLLTTAILKPFGQNSFA
ncbi:FAD-dependent monooxygenase [Spirosoma foliorum]|uniref:Flavin-dependent monooxygenase n=1 Tax=Spirosoma foliorum TaxID=2710596 RepID=A0A7G5GZG1_9BACT|nr:FAD-dependent monooxygenase [Spirosoma foliorum]QMW04253.1 FAD-dependent monooxygenase [Spirosoma foliorum]